MVEQVPQGTVGSVGEALAIRQKAVSLGGAMAKDGH